MTGLEKIREVRDVSPNHKEGYRKGIMKLPNLLQPPSLKTGKPKLALDLVLRGRHLLSNPPVEERQLAIDHKRGPDLGGLDALLYAGRQCRVD